MAVSGYLRWIANKVTLGVKIRRIRQAERLTLSAVAERASMSVSYLNDLEHDRTLPSLGKLLAICGALGLSVRSLLEGVESFDG